MLGVKYGNTEFSIIRCLFSEDVISNSKKCLMRLEAGMEISYNAHKEFFDVVDALHRKGVKEDAQENRAQSCFALQQYS